MSSSPVPPRVGKTRCVGERCPLNLSRAQKSSRWCGMVVRRGGVPAHRYRPRHLTMIQNYERLEVDSVSGTPEVLLMAPASEGPSGNIAFATIQCAAQPVWWIWLVTECSQVRIPKENRNHFRICKLVFVSVCDVQFDAAVAQWSSCQVIYSQFGLAIHQNDHQARRRFVEWAQNEIAVVPDFHKRILFSDEATFWLNGYVNKQNCRIWSEANPQVYVETPLHPEKLTVWCALWADGIIGPYFFKNDEGHNVTVNGDRYRAMITNFFIPELNNHDIQELWFQQHGATCHTARATIDLLKDTFGDRLISRFGPVNRPPRSCDLTPLDYFLWGYVKSLVYAGKPQTLDHLEDNIRRVIADIRPQMLEKVIENWTTSEPAVAVLCQKFVEWAQNEIAVVPDFHKRILFSDEATFWLNGYVNKQNCRIWSEANPQVYVETPLHPEKLTVWCALWAGGILLQKR
ncbi:transposable element Tc3 transposase [Trichonephila clavipes]|nr:transposable element Tc3 transposase [Trichonephila clavipes]